ncbi:hypothetical protein Acsp03_26010 [Actinomadura sp. NBRC 104412]|uniref:RDD family protein n=1 Tax=Actinomadura sp. NBRC 104412 TaxID=3032203 RepID=UPI0024A1C178|nr:RDD family protein [Actinomadura sp. NBRC 104412]GLZ05135.1 hypothetical protein Acsp03_26010 [Actinomadura sp. NBRC 104412]
MSADPIDSAPGAAMVRRAAAWAIDFALALTVAVILGGWTWTRISTLVKDVPGLARQGAWEVISSGGDIKAASADFGSSLWDSASGYVMQAFAALVLIVFVYHFVGLAWKGRTLGKLVLDLRVEAPGRARLGKRQACARAMSTTVCDVGLFAVACCVLLQGAFLLSVVCWLLAVTVFWVNVLPAVFPRRLTVSDRVLGTRVARAHLIRAVAGQAVQGGRAAWQGVQRMAEQDRVQNLGRGAVAKGWGALERGKQAYADRRSGHAPPPAPPALPPPAPPYQAPPVPYQPPEVPSQQQRPGERIPRPEEQ